MKTSVPVARSSSGRYNLRRSLKRKWACACCLGKDNLERCKKPGKLEKPKKNLLQPALIKKTAALSDAAKLYVEITKEKTGIQIPDSLAKLIKAEHNLMICTISLYQCPIYPRIEKEEEVQHVNKNLDERFLLFKEDLINQSMAPLNICIPTSVMRIYLTDGHLPLSILRPNGEMTIYDLVCSFFEEKKHLLHFENNIKAVLLLYFDSIFDQKLLFKNQKEETEYEEKFDEFLNGFYCLQLGLRFLIRFILNLPKWDALMGNFSKETKRDFILCMNELLRYIAENDIQDPTILSYKNTKAMTFDRL